MILYNVTISVEPSISKEWLSWMKNTHINEVMATDLFESYAIYEVLLQQEETITYSVQYFISSMAKLQQYQATYAPALQAKHTQKFGDKVIAFRTVLESV